MTYEKEQQVAQEIARKAGIAIMEVYKRPFDVQYKKDNSPVTEADIQANALINSLLKQAFPKDAILSEELDFVEGDRVWYVDPIDGTRGFTTHTGEFGIQIGLVEGTRPVLGVVYRPTTDEMFVRGPDIPSYKVHTANGAGRISDVRVSTNTSNVRAMERDTYRDNQKRLDLLQRIGASQILYSGSGGLRILSVAENIADFYLVGSPSKIDTNGTWDVAAPEAILNGAGGILYFPDGKPLQYVGQRKIMNFGVAARDEELAKKALKEITK